MKKISSFITSSLMILLVMFFLVPQLVLADGMVIQPDPYSDRWDYSNEDNQQAFINYDNGLQKMILSIGIGRERDRESVWLFPVPADPKKVTIDVVQNLPLLNGEEISGKAKSNLDGILDLLQISQLYTIPFVLFSSGINTINDGGLVNSLGTPQEVISKTEPDVVVYDHVDKNGISSEIITAKTANGLYDYLKGKGLKIEAGSIPVLDKYIGKDFSFIASWINSSKNINIPYGNQNVVNQRVGGNSGASTAPPYENQNVVNQRGVFVTFPTKEIYFPLLPTSVYGSKIVPATIRIIGHVTPEVFQDIKNYTNTTYYIEDNVHFYDDLKRFYNGEEESIKYTKIEINAPSKFLTDDLWLRMQAPIKTYYPTFIAKHPIVTGIILFILSSILSGIFSGMLFFRDLRKHPIKLGLIGLSNVFTIFGLLITTALVRTKERDESIDPILSEIKQKGYFWKRKIISFFVIIPVFIFGIFTFPSLVEDISYSIKYLDFGYFIPVFLRYVVMIVILILSFLAIHIRPEDKNLFEQLKLAGYSSWLFQPKDKMKYVFVPVFSISFLIISWFLVLFIASTV